MTAAKVYNVFKDEIHGVFIEVGVFRSHSQFIDKSTGNLTSFPSGQCSRAVLLPNS